MNTLELILKYRKQVERMANIKLQYVVLNGVCYQVKG